MSDRIAAYVEELGDALLASARRRRGIMEETAAHLADAVDAHVAAGLAADEAEAAALAEFGQVEDVATSFAVARQEVDMLVRYSKPFAAAGGVLTALQFTLHRFAPGTFGGWWFAIGPALILASFPGLHLRQAGRTGRLGRIAFWLLLAAFGLGCVLGVLAAVMTVRGSQDQQGYGLLGLAMPFAVFLLLGFLLFSIATVRANVLPRGAMSLIVVGMIGLAFAQDDVGSPAIQILPWLFGAGWVWLGIGRGPLIDRPPARVEAA